MGEEETESVLRVCVQANLNFQRIFKLLNSDLFLRLFPPRFAAIFPLFSPLLLAFARFGPRRVRDKLLHTEKETSALPAEMKRRGTATSPDVNATVLLHFLLEF